MIVSLVFRLGGTALFLVLGCAATVDARIGDTPVQFIDRYGPPKDTEGSKESDKASPLVQGAIHHRYQYQGWSIRAAFLEFNAVRMEYQKANTAGLISDQERQAIASANLPNGMSWKEIPVPNAAGGKGPMAYFAGAVGGKIWRRTGGAILWMPNPNVIRLELPIAREHELQVKIHKEEKTRSPTPKF